MTYIYLAIICLALFILNTLFDKIASNKICGNVVTFIKSGLCALFVLIYVLIKGDGQYLFKFSSVKEILIILFFGACQAANWLLYFVAMRKSNIDAFSSFNEPSFLFFANLWTLIFNFNNTVNSGSTLSIFIYILGLMFTISGAVLVFFSKKINEGVKRTWVIFDLLACAIGSIYNVTGSLWITDISVEILTFYTMTIITLVALVCSFIKKDFNEIKKVQIKPLLFIAAGALVNVTVFVLRLTANAMTGANIAVVNVIISITFVVITLIQAIVKKKKFPFIVWLVLICLIIGMLLSSFAKSII